MAPRVDPLLQTALSMRRWRARATSGVEKAWAPPRYPPAGSGGRFDQAVIEDAQRREIARRRRDARRLRPPTGYKVIVLHDAPDPDH